MAKFARAVLLTGVSFGFCAIFPVAASATEAPTGTPSQHDIAVIDQVSASPSVTSRLARTSFPGTKAKVDKVAAGHIAVYTPTADFVAGRSSVPATLSYVATPAKTAAGQPVMLWAKRSGSTWRVFNIASGSVEQSYANKSAGGYLVHEPQINGWYAMHGNTVTVLHATRAGLPDGTTMTVAAYQKALSGRYGDKLPGSAYDRKGLMGGYGTETSNDTSWAVPASAIALIAAALLTFMLRRWIIRPRTVRASH